eukprot:1954578-Prymnesium_polylepis.1
MIPCPPQRTAVVRTAAASLARHLDSHRHDDKCMCMYMCRLDQVRHSMHVTWSGQPRRQRTECGSPQLCLPACACAPPACRSCSARTRYVGGRRAHAQHVLSRLCGRNVL